jgi:hypothetical protein
VNSAQAVRSHGHQPVLGVQRVKGKFVEAARREPVAYLRRQVGRPAVPGPDHGSAWPAHRRRCLDGELDVLVADVAEDPAQQQHVGGQCIGESGHSGGVGLAHLDLGQPGLRGSAASRFGVARVGLHQDGVDVVAPRVARQHANDVTALACAEADQAHGPGRRRTDGLGQTLPDLAQPHVQERRRVVVGLVPGSPVPHVQHPAADPGRSRAGHS